MRTYGRRALLALIAAWAALPWPVQATSRAPAEVAADLPGWRLSGSGRMTWFTLPVYDARLWVDAGFRATTFAQHPLALELEYARSLRGELIAERSLEEMRRGGEIGAAQGQVWLASMRELFPDVTRGDRLTAVCQPGRALRIYFNARLRGEIADAQFAPRFLGIWLSPATSEPSLRLALLGERGATT
jgi:Chalcone isomerase-like